MMAEYTAMIESWVLVAHDVIGLMDEIALHSECTSETVKQNAMYNRYHFNTIVNNNADDGTVFLC